MIRLLIAILTLTICTQAAAEERVFTGLRACGASTIGTLQDNDCLNVDRWEATKQYQTTPLDILNYIIPRLNGILAPATHTHPLASTSADGMMSAADKLRLDSAPKTTKGEGAAAIGTWTSLATAGYTVATAQARWPSLAGIILSTDDLAAYGVDWCALQNSANTSAEVDVSAGNHLIERTVTVPSNTQIRAMSRAGTILPHTTWTGAKNLFTVPANANNVTIAGLTLNENPTPSINGGQFTGVYVNSGTYRVKILGNASSSLAHLAVIDKSSNETVVDWNETNDVTQEVYFNKGTTTDWHVFPSVDFNRFMHSYRAGVTYSVQFQDDAQVTYFRVRDNHVTYNALFYLKNLTATPENGSGMFSQISGNTVIGNMNNNAAPLIYWVGLTTYTSEIYNNFLWNASKQIALGGQLGVSMYGNTGADSTGHTVCLLNLVAPVSQIAIGGLAPIGFGASAPKTICADYSLAGTGNLPSATTYSNVTLVGSAVSSGSEIGALSTDYIKFQGYKKSEESDSLTYTAPPDVGSYTYVGINAQTATLPKSNYLYPGARFLYTNTAYNTTNTLQRAGNDSIRLLDGTPVTSMPVPSNTTVEFLLSGTIWRQIR